MARDSVRAGGRTWSQLITEGAEKPRGGVDSKFVLGKACAAPTALRILRVCVPSAHWANLGRTSGARARK